MPSKNHKEEMLAEYDFSNGEKGRYAKRAQKGSNVLVLDPDVAKVFRDPIATNESLRALAKVIRIHPKIRRSNQTRHVTA